MIFLRWILQTTLLLSLFNPITALIIGPTSIITEEEFKPFSSCFPDGTLIDQCWLITSARRETPLIIKLHSTSETCRVVYTITFPKWNLLDHKIGLNDSDKMADQYFDVKLIRLEKPLLNYKPIKRSCSTIGGEASIISFISAGMKNITFDQKSLKIKSLNDVSKTNNSKSRSLVKATLKKLEKNAKKSEPHNYNGRLQQLGTTKISNLAFFQMPYRLFMSDSPTRYECKMDPKNSYDVGAPLMIKDPLSNEILLLGQLFGINSDDPSYFSAVNYLDQINHWINHVLLLDFLGGKKAVESQYKDAVHSINQPLLTRASSEQNYLTSKRSRCRAQKEIIHFEDLFRQPNFLRFALYESFLGLQDYPWYLNISFENLANKSIEMCCKNLKDFWKANLTGPNLGKEIEGILFLASDNALTILTKEALNGIEKDPACRKQFLADHFYERIDFPAEPHEFSKDLTLLKNGKLEDLFALPKTSSTVMLQPHLLESEWIIQFNSSLGKYSHTKIIGEKHNIRQSLDVYEIDKPIISSDLITLLNNKGVAQIFKGNPILHIDSNNTIWNKLKEYKNYSVFCDLLESTTLNKLLTSQTTNGITVLALENDKMNDLLEMFNYKNWNDMNSDDVSLLMKHFIFISKIETINQEFSIDTQKFKVDFFGEPKKFEEDYFEDLNVMNNDKNIKPLKRLVGVSDWGKIFYTLSNSPIHFQCLDQRFGSVDKRQVVTLKGVEIYSSKEAKGSDKVNILTAIKAGINCSNGIIYPLSNSFISSESPITQRFMNPYAN